MRLLPQIQAVGLISPRLFPIDRSFHSRLDRRREKDTRRMARGENNEAHGSDSGNVPAAPAGAAAGGGGAVGGAGVGRGGAVGGAAAAVGADDGRGLWGSGVSTFPEGDNIFHWVSTIAGSAATAYESTSYRLTLAFPSDYPYKPPKVRFDIPCFHPNVDNHGNICVDILQDMWSSAYDIRIILSIQSLLGEPNNDSPLNTQAAATLWANQEEFRKMVEKHYKPAS